MALLTAELTLPAYVQAPNFSASLITSRRMPSNAEFALTEAKIHCQPMKYAWLVLKNRIPWFHKRWFYAYAITVSRAMKLDLAVMYNNASRAYRLVLHTYSPTTPRTMTMRFVRLSSPRTYLVIGWHISQHKRRGFGISIRGKIFLFLNQISPKLGSTCSLNSHWPRTWTKKSTPQSLNF